MKKFFSAAAYLVADGEPPKLVAATIMSPDEDQGRDGFIAHLNDIYPGYRIDRIILSELTEQMQHSVAAKVCSNPHPLQIPEMIRTYLFEQGAAD